jgi:hypothetical protein
MRFLSRILGHRSERLPHQLPREDRLMQFPAVDSKENYLTAFWRWVELLAANEYQQALEALTWPNYTTWTADNLKQSITTFFGGDEPWSVVIPNDRLIGVINDAADFKLRNNDEFGWVMAQIPLTTQPSDPKRDDIPLMGLASSFLVRLRNDEYVLEFEIFHV